MLDADINAQRPHRCSTLQPESGGETEYAITNMSHYHTSAVLSNSANIRSRQPTVLYAAWTVFRIQVQVQRYLGTKTTQPWWFEGYSPNGKTVFDEILPHAGLAELGPLALGAQ